MSKLKRNGEVIEHRQFIGTVENLKKKVRYFLHAQQLDIDEEIYNR